MKTATLLGFILACQVVGLLGAIPTIRAIPGWYATLRRPAWTPPNAAFGPVWTVLYLLMAIAAWRCWLQTGFRDWALPFATQLALNLAWPGIFFGLRRIGDALAEIVALWASILWCLFVMRAIDPISGDLLLPYLLWVTYAVTLNAGFFALNRKGAS